MDKSNYFITKNNKADNFEELVDEAISNLQNISIQSGTALSPAYSFVNSPNTGIYLSNLHHISFSSLGVERFRVADTHITALEPLRLSATDSPALTFTGDLDTGLKWNGNQDMMFITGGLNKFQVSSSFITCYDAPLFIYSNTPSVGQKITFYGYNFSNPQVGTDILQRCAVGNYALEFTPTTLGLGTTDIIYRWKTGGSNEMQFSNRSQLLQTSGSVSVPSYSFQASGNAGIYYLNGVAFSHGSTQRLLISDSGVKIGAIGTNFRHLLYGTISYNVNLNAGVSLVIGPYSFGSTFGSNPQVFLTAFPQSGSAWWDRVSYTISAISTTNFNIQIANSSGSPTAGTVILQWMAIGN